MRDFLHGILMLPEVASSYAAELDGLHMVLFVISFLGSMGLFLAAVWFAFRYRARANRQIGERALATPRGETLAIGGILGLFIAFWVAGFWQYLTIVDPPRAALDVYVVGKQWMWKFVYPNGHSSVGTLTVPVDTPVRLIMTSRDVIHSFFVPAFRAKQDVLPGRYVSMWFKPTRVGTFQALCTEYCGVSHSRMLAQVTVLSRADHAAWLASIAQAPPPDGPENVPVEEEAPEVVRGASNLAEQGRQLSAAKGCFACHTETGQAHIGPTWKGLYGKTETLKDGTTVNVDEAYLTRSMMDPMAEVVAGYNPVMPTYQGSLSATETAAIVEFIRSLSDRAPEPVVDLPQVAPLEKGEPRPVDAPAGDQAR